MIAFLLASMAMKQAKVELYKSTRLDWASPYACLNLSIERGQTSPDTPFQYNPINKLPIRETRGRVTPLQLAFFLDWLDKVLVGSDESVSLDAIFSAVFIDPKSME